MTAHCTPSISWRLRLADMDCSVPTSDIIPAVAARLKYYLDVERKEAGFDLSINQKDPNINFRLYQLAGSHELHPTQRMKNNFLDNKMEASFQSYTGKSGTEWNQNIKINKEWKQQVQRKLKKKMSYLTPPDLFSSNHAHLKIINCKCSNWEDFSSGLGNHSPTDISPEELRRLVASAANLIVAATSGLPLQHKSQSRKAPCLDEGSHTHGDESMDQTVPATSENIDYEIVIHTGTSSPEQAEKSLFIRLVGDNGRSKILFLQNSLVNPAIPCAGQAAMYHVKTKDVGELKYIIMGVDRTSQDSRCYCRNVTVKKGTTNYVFPCNKWLSQSQAVMIHATEPFSTDNVLPEPAKGAKSCNRNNKRIITSSVDTKRHDCKTTSKGLKIASCRHVGQTAKKVIPDKLDVPKRNVNKPVVSQGRPKSKERAAMRKHSSVERTPADASSVEKAAPAVSSEEKGGTELDCVTRVWDNPTNPIDSTEDGSSHLSLLGENNIVDLIFINSPGPVDNPPIQDKTEADELTTLKYRKASSPASYLFSSHESKESPVIVKLNGHANRNASSGLSNAGTRETMTASSDGTKQSCLYSFSGFNKEESDSRASQLLLLQQLLLESEDSSTVGSPQQQPMSNCVNNAEAVANVDDDNEVHSVHAQISGYVRSCCQLDSEAIQTSAYCCSCGYESDSTLCEDFLFFDTSLDLSLSENEDSETPSKSSNLCERPQYNIGEQDMRQAETYQNTSRKQRLDCCNKNVNLFVSSLAAIHSHDYMKLRNLCKLHFFLPSFIDGEGKTLLHHAAYREDPRMCQVLLDTNVGMVNIDHQDIFGKTALHYAVQNGNSKTVKLLLDNDAKLEIPDQNLKTVLDVALGKLQTK